MHGRTTGNAGGFGEWYAPETSLISAPLENGRFRASYCDVITVMNCGAFVAFMENGNVSIVCEGSNAESRVFGQGR